METGESAERFHSKMFLGKSTTGMRFKVVLKIKCLLPVRECKVRLDSPRTIFCRMRTFSIVVLIKAVSHIFRKPGIVLSRTGKAFQHIHEIQAVVHNCPASFENFAVAGFALVNTASERWRARASVSVKTTTP